MSFGVYAPTPRAVISLEVKKIDQSKFDATFKRYLDYNGRSFSEACNTKGFWVARGAKNHTLKTKRSTVEGELGRVVSVQRISKKGTIYYRKAVQHISGRNHPAPLAALIINARRGKKQAGGFGMGGAVASGGGLYGREMTMAIRRLIGARLRSIAYIASGWLEPIYELARYANTNPGDMSDVKRFGKAKGGAEPAQVVSSWKFICKIWNEAWAKNDKKNAFERVGNAGLQAAIDDETASMEEYIKRKMQPAADEFNRSQR